MENQHRKIAGYRELNQEEVDLMNRIKAAGAGLLQLQAELYGRLDTERDSLREAARRSVDGHEVNGYPATVHAGATPECIEFRRFQAAEPQRWAELGKTDIQTGIMALVRAVAQPAGV